MTAAKAILETRGSTPRLYRNTLVFLAVDKTRLQDLDEAVRKYLAWQSILDEKEALDLSPFQVKQAETQKNAADGAVTARIPEAYQWLLVPVQATPQSAITWQALRISGSEALAVRASKKLKNDELLITSFAASRLRMELDRIPLWRTPAGAPSGTEGAHVAIKLLVEDFARYIYLPRLQDPEVLLDAIRDGVTLLTWPQDAFAYSDGYDEAAKRYRGLRAGQNVSIPNADTTAILVKPDVALKQMEAEPGGSKTRIMTATAGGIGSTGGARPGGGTDAQPTTVHAAPPMPKRFHGTVSLDPQRVGRDASRIAEEVIAHLSSLDGAEVTVTLEIEADLPSGAPDNVVRTVTENSRALKFTSQGFEEE